MRWTKKLSMWPVGLVTGYGLSTPVLKDGKFDGWYDGWLAGRKFPVDMAGFGFSVELLKSVILTIFCKFKQSKSKIKNNGIFLLILINKAFSLSFIIDPVYSDKCTMFDINFDSL